jgi:hypothetical protein
VSGIIVTLACILIVWPAVKDVQVALAWVDRPYRFVIETDGGYYLVDSSHRMSDEELRALFRRAVFELVRMRASICSSPIPLGTLGSYLADMYRCLIFLRGAT